MYMTLCTTQQYFTHLHGHVLNVKGNSHFNPHLTIKFILSNPTNNSDNTGILQVQNALLHERVNSTSIQELQFSKEALRCYSRYRGEKLFMQKRDYKYNYIFQLPQKRVGKCMIIILYLLTISRQASNFLYQKKDNKRLTHACWGILIAWF